MSYSEKCLHERCLLGRNVLFREMSQGEMSQGELSQGEMAFGEKCLTFCENAYTTSDQLRIHVRIKHAGLKNHECIECGKEFGRRKTLNAHIKNMHSRERKLEQCPFCDKELKDYHYMQRHIRTIHEGLEKQVYEVPKYFKGVCNFTTT